MGRLWLLIAVVALALAAAPALLFAAAEVEAGERSSTVAPATPATGPASTTPPARQPTSSKRSSRLLGPRSPFLIRKIKRHRRATWYWQDVMGKPRTESAFSDRKSRVKAYRKWVLRLWKRRHAQARRQALHPPNEWAWLCLQRYEGSWRDPHPPYWGGLQMDMSFMRAYGSRLLSRKGTADRWTPLEQMWVAERALRAGRGFYPWPNTARKCGLL